MKSHAKYSLPFMGMLLLLFLQPLLSAQGTAKTPVPGKGAQDKGYQLVLAVFGDDLKSASTSDAKTKLASVLFQQGKEVKDDAAVRYVCFREALELAAKAGDVNLTLSVIEEINRGYDIDGILLKAQSLNTAATATTDEEAGAALVEVIRPLLNEAAELDHYKAAYILGEAAITAAKKARSPSMARGLEKRMEEIQSLEKNFAKLNTHLERLQKQPADAEANFQLGHYFGYQKRRWEKALPYFAAGSDQQLAQLAKHDLGQPADVKDQLSLADDWWDRAGQEKDPARTAMQIRASYWYDKAIPNLTGLNRTKAQKRIDQVQDQLSSTPSIATSSVTGPVGEIKKFEGHTDEVKGVALSADGRYAASASKDKTVRIWDLSGGKDSRLITAHTDQVWGVAFHPNHRQLFSASWDKTIRLWDIKTGNEVKRYTHGKDVNGLALTRDASHMLSGCDDEKVYYWNANTGEEIRKYTGNTNFVYTVAFSPDGKHMASGGYDRLVRYYDLKTMQPLKTFDGHNDPVNNVVFTSDGRYIISCGDTVIRVWDVTIGKEAPRRFEGHSGRVPTLAISPDGKRLATGGDDRTIKLWDVASGKLQHTLTGHIDTVTSVAFSHDGRRLISGSGSLDRTVRVWNLPR